MPSTLRSLADIISQSVDALEANCAKRGVSVPSLDDLFAPDKSLPRDDPEVLRATDAIVAASFQFIQTVRPPQLSLVQLATGVRTFAILSIIIVSAFRLHVDTVTANQQFSLSVVTHCSSSPPRRYDAPQS